ncbi:radical SAM protein [Clostridium sp. SHJSY1]|uniref:radical SAM protein n=1 Tax=Clostridium sp. SHJSY1 TaxID=2942483 RepID=UPI00287669C0|nr:radical SAM protein [Clostridium sp. SHJSY1]MDS0525363.1 radical SAM protein [Clostridium sp. SHJSY1]
MKYSSLLENCKLCKRQCGVNRLKGELGVCSADSKIKVAKAYLHLWEEPPVSLGNGSGTIFFSHCNLKCVFCQNHEISQEFKGKFITIERLSEIFLELQCKGSSNINLVTPTHYVPQIKEAIEISKKNGLTLPILYNTNGYDTLDTIKSLNGFIDVYLPDFKYYNDKYAIRYSNAISYEENIILILNEMIEQVGEPIFDSDGRILKGVIIRHLMLPGLLFDSKKIIDKIYNTFGDKVYISIMNQYTPMYNSKNYPEINKLLNPKHYNSLIEYAESIGVSKGFIQDVGTNNTSYVPNFNFQGI